MQILLLQSADYFLTPHHSPTPPPSPFPAAPTFDAAFHTTISPAAAAAISVGIIAGAVVGGAVLLGGGVALGWRLIMGKPGSGALPAAGENAPLLSVRNV